MAFIQSISIFLVIVIVAFLFVQLFYLPKFLFEETKVELSSEQSDQITIMSTNVRCYSPEDVFKKSWFYRALILLSRT